MDKIVNNVFETYDYSQFKKLLGNRNVNHEKDIMESIRKNGEVRIPIIVNEKFEIIDGQNTFNARKQLSLPIYYIICEGYGIKECIAMNTTAKNWAIEDYVNCYAEYGMEDYILLRDLEKKYGSTLPKILIRSIAAGNIGSYSATNIKNGVFKIKDTKDNIQQTLDYLMLFEIPRAVKGNAKLLYSVLRYCFEAENVDNSRMLTTWNSYSHQIEGVTDIKSAAEAIERIYNFHRKNGYVFIAAEYRNVAEKKCAVVLGGGRASWKNKKEDYNE